jgi:diaminohydroxyphosphoribosylaminopyrimidine deaminase/5-amino-6-(5-phosphoribosylamino)uracil reductase
VTLEPCSHHGKTPPCADAIIAAGIVRVVSAIEDPNPEVAGQGHARLRAQGIRVDIGHCADDARRAHAGHIRRILEGRPHILLKLAVSVDGKAGLAGRKPVAITGEVARDRVHMMRAMNDGVLIGIGTAIADDPLLTCRLPGMRSPVRIVLDAALRLPVTSRLVAGASDVPVWVVTAPDVSVQTERALTLKGVRVLRVPRGPKGVDLPAAMRALAREGLTRLMVEGGPTVAASFVVADLVDEAALLRSPNAIGADGIAALEGLPLSALTQSQRLHAAGTERAGADTIELFARA